MSVVLTTDQKRAIAELAIAHQATTLGIGVVKPITPERYDLIFDLRPHLMRVQCKWAVRYDAVVVIRRQSSRRAREGIVHRAYTADEVDLVAAYCADIDRCFLLPSSVFSGRRAVQLRVDPSRNGQKRRINWPEDFELAATLRRLGP